jgi:light-regulated signal transduction histidine kinase (bacteriophytochrome)
VGGETSPEKERLLCRKAIFSQMTEQKNPLSQAPSDVEKIPEDLSVEMRRIAHDLSNALEIIIQTSYLLSTVEMKEPASDWLRMLEGGVQKAMNLNLELRNYIKEHTSS